MVENRAMAGSRNGACLAMGMGDPEFVSAHNSRAREAAVSNHSPEEALDVKQGCHKPSVLLVGVLQMACRTTPLFGHAVDGLGQVGGPRGSAHGVEYTEAV